MSKEQIEEKSCKKCLHHAACVLNGEYLPTLCRLYDAKANYRKQEWISVDERLPDKEGVYLVYTYKGYMKISKYSGWGIDDEASFDDFFVTHWMPLPEPPKGV